MCLPCRCDGLPDRARLFNVPQPRKPGSRSAEQQGHAHTNSLAGSHRTPIARLPIFFRLLPLLLPAEYGEPNSTGPLRLHPHAIRIRLPQPPKLHTTGEEQSRSPMRAGDSSSRLFPVPRDQVSRAPPGPWSYHFLPSQPACLLLRFRRTPHPALPNPTTPCPLAHPEAALVAVRKKSSAPQQGKPT